MVKVLTVFGTRPEAIKMAPVVNLFKKNQEQIESKVCVTGQHREMLDPILALFGITPDYDLDLMVKDQSLEHITKNTLIKVSEIIEREKPEYLFVQGDTTTSMAASLAAFYKHVKVAHIEAGLRTGNIYEPFPEEVNRKMIDQVSSLYFVHTEQAKQNLINEAVNESKIEITGNTVLDALIETSDQLFDIQGSVLSQIPFESRKIILVTAHRRESFGTPLENICHALKELAQKYTDQIHMVFPVHLNPNVQNTVKQIINDIHNISLLEPLDYLSFVNIFKSCYLVLSDSGGIQEEAPTLNKPVLVLRDVTERPEAHDAGATLVVGTETERIVHEASRLIESESDYQRMAQVANPYGDGQASLRIVARLLKEVHKDG